MDVDIEQLGDPVDVRPLFAPLRSGLIDLLGSLAPEDWGRATPCAGWDVADLAAHLLGDDLGRLARTRDGVARLDAAPDEALPTFIDRINDEWVVAARRMSPRLLVEMLAWTGAQIAEMWTSMPLEQPGDGVSWAGLAHGPVWLDAGRDLTEYWIHERQLREATGLLDPDPEGAAVVLDVLARGLPYALRHVGVPEGAVVAVHTSAPDIGWSVTRRDKRWWVGPPDKGADPVATVTASATALWRRWTRHPENEVRHLRTDGDKGAAAAVIDHVAIILSAG